MRLGDMTIIGEHPPKMLKALAVIADSLHPAYDALPGTVAGASNDLCLFCSLAVRDALVAIGWCDATVRTCAVTIDGERGGVPLAGLGIGMPRDPRRKDKFNCHAVVEVPSLRLLIDPTIGQAKRERWPELPTMFAAPIAQPDPPFLFHDMPMITSIEMKSDSDFVRVGWWDRPEVNFRRELDFVDPSSRERRRALARALRARFGEWHEVEEVTA